MATESMTTAAKSPAEQGNQAELTRSGFYYRPNVDILEFKDELIVQADVPGATPEGIDVNFEEGNLTIHAKVDPRNEEANYLVRQYGVGDFWRTFQIAETIDSGKISAEYADGVLTLHLPKAESAKPRKISVKA
jgi:HSP20 family protein